MGSMGSPTIPAGVRPGQIRGAPDLYLIPVTTKGDLRAAPPGDLFARGVDPGKLITHITGGSTGEPSRFIGRMMLKIQPA